MSRLPQELIDHIIDHHHHDADSLKACSLVSSQWSARSRKHLFRRVVLYLDEAELGRWCARIRLGPSGPSSLVERLSLVGNRLSMPMEAFEIRPLKESISLSDAIPYLRSFSRLRALKISGWDTGAVQVSLMIHCFGASVESVTDLRLERMYIHPLNLAAFISHFPHLSYFSIFNLRPVEEGGAGGVHHSSS